MMKCLPIKASRIFFPKRKYFSTSDGSNYYLEYHSTNSVNKNISKNKICFMNDEQIHKYNPTLTTECQFARNFVKEVTSLCLNENNNKDKFSEESINKAEEYLKRFRVGAYSCSKGIDIVRQNVAKKLFIRDGFSIDQDDIFLTYGGMDAYGHIIGLFNKNETILMPSPCHPLYLSMNMCYGLKSIFYNNLEELNFENLPPKNKPKAMLVINPNNPTGQILKIEEMKKIIKFCYENKMVLICSEVLQDLCHQKPFNSFRKITSSMPYPYNLLEVLSFHSISKSLLFEGASRAGFLDIMNLDPDVKKELYKHISMDICTSVSGQIILDILSIASQKNENQNETFKKIAQSLEDSKNELYQNFKSKITLLKEDNNDYFRFKMPEAGFTLFIELIKNNFKSEKNPNCEIYSKTLFEETGIYCTPGTEYGKFENNIVINMNTSLIETNNLKEIKKFNNKFFNEFTFSNVIEHTNTRKLTPEDLITN